MNHILLHIFPFPHTICTIRNSFLWYWWRNRRNLTLSVTVMRKFSFWAQFYKFILKYWIFYDYYYLIFSGLLNLCGLLNLPKLVMLQFAEIYDLNRSVMSLLSMIRFYFVLSLLAFLQWVIITFRISFTRLFSLFFLSLYGCCYKELHIALYSRTWKISWSCRLPKRMVCSVLYMLFWKKRIWWWCY